MRRGRSGVILGRIGGAVSVLTVVLASVSGALGATSRPTQLVHYRVFATTGKVVGIHVGRTLRGSCFSGSIGLPRPDAWRCMVGNEILDPCLESPRGTAAPLVCVNGKQGVALRLTKPLPLRMRNQPENLFFAWRLVLANGEVCERFTGTAAGAIQGQGLVYGCNSGGTTTEPDRRQTHWTVRYRPKNVNPSSIHKLTQLKLLPITEAVG
jgi:hypothetical protein